MRRSLESVKNQTRKADHVLVVSDDFDHENYECRTKPEDVFEVIPKTDGAVFLHNKRTRHHSGTGAWNTGIYWALQNVLFVEGGNNHNDNPWIAISDDDDVWDKTHIEDCLAAA